MGLRAAVSHPLGEARDPPGVLPFLAEVVAGDEPVGALSGSGGLDVGGLLTGLPAAGQYDGALDGRALLAVDMLRVGQPQRVQVLAGQLDLALRPVEREGHAPFVDVRDLAAGAVLDSRLSSRAVLGGERDQVAFAQAVVDAG